MNAEAALILVAGVVIGVPALLLMILFVNRLTGRRIIPWWATTLFIFLTPAAGSLMVDAAGTVYRLNVLEMKESISYWNNFHYSGRWSRRFQVKVEHPPNVAPESSYAPFLMVGADGPSFDALEVGRPAEVRIFTLGKFRFGRLASRSTSSIIRGWLGSEPRGPWREATGKVLQINDFNEQMDGSREPMPWPYRIVRFSFTPGGRREPIETLDTIETASLPALTEDASVPILWPEDNPRAARLAGAQPGKPWLNWFYELGELLLLVGALLAILVLYRIFKGRNILS